MVEYHEAVLHAVREGLLLVDGEQRVQLANDEARRLLDLDGDPAGGTSANSVSRMSSPRRWLAGDGGRRDPRDRHACPRSEPGRGRPSDPAAGTVVTLRDHTELQTLTGELDSVRAFAESLRAQSHEAANRLHTTVSLVELGRLQEAVDFATAELASAQRLTDRVVDGVDEPVLAALLLGKAATAHERGVALEIDPPRLSAARASRG